MKDTCKNQSENKKSKKIIRLATKILPRSKERKVGNQKRPQKRGLNFEINRISTVLN